MNHSSRLPSLLTVALALFTLAGCATTPPPASTLPADAWILSEGNQTEAGASEEEQCGRFHGLHSEATRVLLMRG